LDTSLWYNAKGSQRGGIPEDGGEITKLDPGEFAVGGKRGNSNKKRGLSTLPHLNRKGQKSQKKPNPDRRREVEKARKRGSSPKRL